MLLPSQHLVEMHLLPASGGDASAEPAKGALQPGTIPSDDEPKETSPVSSPSDGKSPVTSPSDDKGEQASPFTPPKAPSDDKERRRLLYPHQLRMHRRFRSTQLQALTRGSL